MSGRRASGQYTRKRTARIQQRDGWVCHLCGGEIDRTLKAPHPGSWETDHIIPIAHTGPAGDADWNCAPSHRKCNRAKGDRITPSMTHPHVVAEWQRLHPTPDTCTPGQWPTGRKYTEGPGIDFDPATPTTHGVSYQPCLEHAGGWLRVTGPGSTGECASRPW